MDTNTILMDMKEKKWGGVSRSSEEDDALMHISGDTPDIRVMYLAGFIVMSLAILGVYVMMNLWLYPNYPVIKPGAETVSSYGTNYPPFRAEERITYEIAQETLGGRLFAEGSRSREYPVGNGVLAAPLTAWFGDRGIYLANTFLLWATALLFFFLMTELVEFGVAVAATLALAFATPNLFYAVSGFPGPGGQFLMTLSLFLLVRAMMSRHDQLFLILSGLAAGLLVFFQPVMVLAAPVFAMAVMFENDRWTPLDRQTISLACGFILPLLAFFGINVLFRGSVLGTIDGDGHSVLNVLTGVWALLFSSPHGIIFLMPMAVLLPMGLIAMWRNDVRSISIAVGGVLGLMIILVATGPLAMSGDSMGSRLLVPVIPLMVVPLAYLWHEHLGERVWLSATLALSIYMCGFGWWMGDGSGPLVTGVLHDREARAIILSRKGLLERPVNRSARDLESHFIAAIEKNDLEAWLVTIDEDILSEIKGSERTFFDTMHRAVLSGEARPEDFIVTTNPDRGVVPHTVGE